MKRSHAVLLIAEHLIEPKFPDDSLKEASSILKKLEKAGMFPPMTEVNVGSVVEGGPELWTMEPVWEKEDEST